MKTTQGKIIGYTSGVFDLFHIGHLNILKSAKSMCDKLIVAVTTDEVALYKSKKPVIPFEERIEIVQNIKYVDVAIPQYNLDKYEAWKKLKFDICFIGDDWYGKTKWNVYEKNLKKEGVKVVYFPYTRNTSSTKIVALLDKLINR